MFYLYFPVCRFLAKFIILISHFWETRLLVWKRCSKVYKSIAVVIFIDHMVDRNLTVALPKVATLNESSAFSTASKRQELTPNALFTRIRSASISFRTALISGAQF